MSHWNNLPQLRLGVYPTPFYRLENISRIYNKSIWIKRDDLCGVALGGNKVRKLEYVLGEARARGCDTVVSYGATQSNCAMQVATACRRLGMRPILYLVAIVEPAELRANLLLDYVLDAEVHLVPLNGGTEEEAEEEAVRLGRAHMARLEGEGHICCEVPMGAAQPLGSAGFIGGGGGRGGPSPPTAVRRASITAPFYPGTTALRSCACARRSMPSRTARRPATGASTRPSCAAGAWPRRCSTASSASRSACRRRR